MQLAMQMLGEMIRQEQALQGEVAAGEAPADEQMSDWAQQQAALAEQLAQMMEGMQQEGDFAQAMQQALSHEQRAEGQLQQSPPMQKPAAQEMQQAVQAMQQAQQSLALQMTMPNQQPSQQPPMMNQPQENMPTQNFQDRNLSRAPVRTGAGAETGLPKTWEANLPKRVRKELSSGSFKSMPPKYARMLRHYSSALSREE